MDTTTELMSAEEEEVICGLYEGYSTQRFIIITICTTVALFGVFANLLLMAVFRRSLPSSIFLATLATCDCLICLTYTLLFGVDAGIWYRKNTVIQRSSSFIIDTLSLFSSSPKSFNSRYRSFSFSLLLRDIYGLAVNREGLILLYFRTITHLFQTNVLSDIQRKRTNCHCNLLLYAMKVSGFRSLMHSNYTRVQVKTFPGCDDYFRSESVAGTSFAATEAYEIYDFHVITAIQMIFPFVVLLLLNFTIIKRLVAEKRENMYPILRSAGTTTEVKKTSFVQGNLPENYVLLQVAADVIKESLIHSSVAVSSEIVQNEDAEDDDIDCSVDVDMPRHRPSIFHTFVLALRESSRSKRSQLRNAIYTMLAIVTSYLVCNGVHLFLTILERFDPSYLYDSVDSSQSSTFYIGEFDMIKPECFVFFSVLSDTVSICYMISSAIRILIYAKCNPKLRQEISDYVKREKSIETNSS
ncbi:hypothetical protein CRE_01845 [Caenorhabditis remanei]|uniref:G-protein coupled receptors family 1 profile domain-containing protein n=1 Tax=Caenorhabditis remanei TaxID=31234 RepID=E3LFT3_CAERE|nr:hypothetical protein CRE_01845 [Caenorhabditis remanei]